MQVRINEPDVVFEAFDEEIVLVNLETGNYYSLRGSGPNIWMALVEGVSVESLAAAIAAATGKDSEEVRGELATFVDQLVAAQIVVTLDHESLAEGVWEGAFEAPTLETYTDMQDLLLLDPVHDVDSSGWPQAKGA